MTCLLKISPADLSGFQVFNLKASLGNHVTIAVKGTSHPPSAMDSRGRFGINLLIWGDFGPWQYYWSHAGGPDETWWNWLEDTDMDYFLNKVVGQGYREFDARKSIAMVHKAIEEQRESLMMDLPFDDKDSRSADALACLHQDLRDAHITLRELGEDCSEERFFSTISSLTYRKIVPLRLSSLPGATTTRELSLLEGYYDMGYTRTQPRLVWFWKNVWRPFIEEANRTQGFTQ